MKWPRDPSWNYLFALLGLCAGLAVCTVAARNGMGDVPTWVNALATVAAVIAASVAALFAARTLGIEQKRDDRYELLERSAQASLIAMWPVMISNGVDEPVGAVAIRNASQVPVYDVEVVQTGGDIDYPRVLSFACYLPLVPPTDEPRYFDATDTGGLEILIPAGSTVHPGYFPQYGMGGHSVTFALRFRDARGIWWLRDRDGLLHEMADRNDLPARYPRR